MSTAYTTGDNIHADQGDFQKIDLDSGREVSSQ